MDRKSKERIFYNNKFFLKNRVGITTGDPKGIGMFVAIQGLQKLKPKKDFQFVIWTNKKSFSVSPFKVKSFKTAKEALASPFNPNEILQIKSSCSAGDWVEEAARLCLEKKLSALVTGPISKLLMAKNKHKAKGHTELFRRLCSKENIFMVFLGHYFNVALLTDHTPLSKVKIDKQKLESLIVKTLKLRSFLKPALRKKPIGLLGLNPHAGEVGLLGKEEFFLKPLLLKFKGEVEGFLVPDAAFLKKNWNRYSFFISLYHDQGLIPFKMIHKHKGVAFSLGLPFIRTGVDHGTGLGLKKSEIKSDSFYLALKKALFLIKGV